MNGLIVIYLLIKREKRKEIIRQLAFLNTGMLGVYLLSYVQFFRLGGSIIQWLQIQKYVVGYYLFRTGIDTTKTIGSYIPLIYLNQWKFWSPGYPYIQYENWSIYFPLSHFLGIVSMVYLWQKKIVQKHPGILFLFVFVVLYSIQLFVTPVWPRYLVLLFIPLYILISIAEHELLLKKKIRKKLSSMEAG